MRRVEVHQVVFGVALTAALGLLAWLAWQGASYYATPLALRPRHPGYWTFKPGGSRGLVYGGVGTGLMLAMLVYSLRKRVRAFRNLGKIRAWLAFHIFCGIVGPLFIVLHTSLKLGGIVALSFWSMVAVALSGVLGRYLYGRIPRTRAGDELTLEAVEAERAAVDQRLREELGLPEPTLERLALLARSGPAPGSGLGVLLLRLPWDGLRLRLRLRRFRAELAGVPGPLRRRAFGLIRRKALLERRIAMWSGVHRLFHYWHVVHKPFAVVMYLVMALHVATATLTGYGLPFG